MPRVSYRAIATCFSLFAFSGCLGGAQPEPPTHNEGMDAGAASASDAGSRDAGVHFADASVGFDGGVAPSIDASTDAAVSDSDVQDGNVADGDIGDGALEDGGVLDADVGDGDIDATIPP
ncbi:MAG: hypothetical protein IPK60_13050 [Sandaracinaceae bacterium]|jgi:hypothetical protein|nr:hypothetical protein [Sandaracinaceae bacterium]